MYIYIYIGRRKPIQIKIQNMNKRSHDGHDDTSMEYKLRKKKKKKMTLIKNEKRKRKINKSDNDYNQCLKKIKTLDIETEDTKRHKNRSILYKNQLKRQEKYMNNLKNTNKSLVLKTEKQKIQIEQLRAENNSLQKEFDKKQKYNQEELQKQVWLMFDEMMKKSSTQESYNLLNYMHQWKLESNTHNVM